VPPFVRIPWKHATMPRPEPSPGPAKTGYLLRGPPANAQP
jgi:hypothetical protein